MSTLGQAQSKKADTNADRAHPLLVLGAVVVIVVPAFVFLGARVRLPGDGAQLQFESFREAERGLLVNVNRPQPGGLRDGDRVLAIADRPVDQWLVMAFRGTRNAPAGEGPVVYTVLRNNQVEELSVALSRQPLPVIIGRNWTSYLFLTYLWAIGLVVFALRPTQTNAQGLLLFSSLLMGSGLIFFLLIQPSDLLHGWLFPLWIWGALILYIIFAGAAIHFVLIFPTKRAILRQRPSLPLAGYLGSLLLWVLSVALRWPEATTPSARFFLVVTATNLLSATAMPLSVLIALHGYRNETDQVERRQVRWFLWAIVVAIIPWQALSVIPELLGYRALISQSLTSLLWLAIPTALAIAILREGLFDIDVIINRTLVYGGLTGMLAALHFVGVAFLQSAFRATAGQESPLAIVLSTLGIAALFNPLRRRIQGFIDRRFYRRKFDAALLLAEFGRTVRDEVDLGRMQEVLISTVQDTLQPAHVSLWVRSGPEDLK